MSSNPPELGPDRRGPDFARPGSGGPAPYGQPYQNPYQTYPNQAPNHGGPSIQPPQYQPPMAPRPSRAPVIITAIVIAVVAAIVIVASVRAADNDQKVVRERSTPTPTPTQASPPPSGNPNSISFTSSEGSGQLTLVSHDWSADGARPPRYGQFLRVQLKISATDGKVSYGPEFFQTFDETGNLFQTTEVGAQPPLLKVGVLRAGQSTTGDIAFDMPRGAVTLLMSNSLLESVTALRIAD